MLQGSISSLKNNANPAYYLLISVDYTERVPFGNPPNETPVRHPYASPLYQLHLLESSEVNHKRLGKNRLCIGKFKLKNEELLWDSAYIPPQFIHTVFPSSEATLQQYGKQP